MRYSSNRGSSWLLALLFSAATLAIPSVVLAAFNVPPSEKLNLQTLLDQHGHLILEPNGNYQSSALPTLTMSSGQKIEGGYGTFVPKIIIPGGVSDVTIDSVLSGVWPDNRIEFTGVLPPGSPTSDPTNYNVTIVGGTQAPGQTPYLKVLSGGQIEGLQATFIGGIDALLDEGYIRNSILRGVVSRSRLDINIKLRGNSQTPSYGNSIVRFMSITSPGAATISKFGDLHLIGANAENWYCNTPTYRPRQSRAFIFSDMDALRMVGLSGGTPSTGCIDIPGAELEVSNIPNVVTWFDRPNGGDADAYDEYFDNVSTYIATQPVVPSWVDRLFTNSPENFLELESLAFHVRPYPSGTFLNGTDVALGVTQDQADRLLNAYLGTPRATQPRKPEKRSVDPLGCEWNRGLSSKPDSSASLQARIDQEHIVVLEPGTYYLDAPLKIGDRNNVEGIIGYNKDSVFLISKGNFPVIQGRGDISVFPAVGVSIVLEDLSIYGGTYGLDMSAEPGNLGPSGQIRWSSFKDMRFARQSIAGVRFDHVYGADTNRWYRVDFSTMPIAVKGVGEGVGPGQGYADKQYFIDNQYHNISEVVWNWQSNRPSGGETWIDSYFYNVGALSKTVSGTELMWVNNVFDNVTGPVAIDILDSGSTSTNYFTQVDCLWKGTGPTVVTDTFSAYIGALFIDTEFAQNGGSLVATTGAQSLLTWNSKITGSATVGNVTYGAFVNSDLGTFNKKLTYIHNGVATDVVNTPAEPYRQVMPR